MTAHPQSDEYAEFYAGYVQRVPQDSAIFEILNTQPDDLAELLENTSDAQANIRPAPGEWSIKEVMGHICDTERVFAYRALRIARGDQQPLAGFDQDAYVAAADFNKRTLSSLIAEFALQRRANLLCFESISEAELDHRGTASNNPVSVRALLFIMAGHVLHHIESLKTTYKVAG